MRGVFPRQSVKDEKRKKVCVSNTQTFSHIAAQNATPRAPRGGGGPPPPPGDDDAAYDFRAATPDGTETGLNAFRVRVRKQTVTARTPSGKTVPFCRFAKGE